MTYEQAEAMTQTLIEAASRVEREDLEGGASNRAVRKEAEARQAIINALLEAGKEQEQ